MVVLLSNQSSGAFDAKVVDAVAVQLQVISSLLL
jgi:hypothetical protein